MAVVRFLTNCYSYYTWSFQTRWKHAYVIWFDDEQSLQKFLNWMISIRAANAFLHPLTAQMAHGRDPLCECFYQEAVIIFVHLTKIYTNLGIGSFN